MQDRSLPHKTLCLSVFGVCCLILTIFYYDNTIMNYAVPYETEELTFYEVKNFSFIDNSTVSATTIRSTSFSVTKSSKSSTTNINTKANISKNVLQSTTRFSLPHEDNVATLYIDTKAAPSYTNNGVTCCYSNITRVNYSKDPDSKIKLSTCMYFENATTISKDPVYVKCLDIKSRRQIFENVHVAILIDEKIRRKIDNTTNPFSVLFIGIDSISRLNFIRSLPKTHNFVESNNWISLKGYNKIDDNTFPNLMAILTGLNNSRSYDICNPKIVGKLDKCPMIWYDFRKLGYVTAYAEDSGSINTFNYRKKGFAAQPVDYYFRPYVLGTERLSKTSKDGIVYCTGPETAGERIMNLAKDFSTTFKNYTNFGFFWMNSFSHNDVNTPSLMDDKLVEFLKILTERGVTNNSIIIFLSDHGMRFGDIRLTDTGWLEERLPFIYVSFPDWFKNNFKKEYENFIDNTDKLTTPYDLHVTLKHLLLLYDRNYKTKNSSEACPKCKSLFRAIDSERSCSDAGIDQHWCTCAGYKKRNIGGSVSTKLGAFLLNVIHDIIRSRTSDRRCVKYSVEKILDTRISERFTWKNDSYILFQIRTRPKAIFETTIRYFGDINTSNYSISGDISRLDSYSEHSKCVSDAYLKKYCYCSSNGEKV
ncbi:uncharacterized protein LOC130445543 isoform X2 [Diorhabda sublineata]|uniref:uncharacterized protein LOC130445543 isoform X2 n=1 Tax=Diorhabda sublineata TaxID=1163346 RepID=UPI0024E05115|nr:uncharacterized protein LOC130445543 isoform X2 [Diorhabda sublineata]